MVVGTSAAMCNPLWNTAVEVCVSDCIFVWKRQSLGHARCYNPLGDLRNLLAVWMCVCGNVSLEPCLCLMVVLSTRWPSEPDGVWLHASESVCVSHLWTSWHPSQSLHPPTHPSTNTIHPSPLSAPIVLSVGCDHIKVEEGGLQVSVPRGKPSISLTVTLSPSLSFIPATFPLGPL